MLDRRKSKEWLAYKNAGYPGLDDSQMGGEDREPRHRDSVLRSCDTKAVRTKYARLSTLSHGRPRSRPLDL